MWNDKIAAVDTRPSHPQACEADCAPRTISVAERLNRALAQLREINNGAEGMLSRVRDDGGKTLGCGINKCPEISNPSLEELSREDRQRHRKSGIQNA